MAFVLLRMPCSESEVERVFTRLRRLFGNHARDIRYDLVEARLTVIMNTLDVTPDFARGLSQMKAEAPQAPDPQPLPPRFALPFAVPSPFVNWTSRALE
jgi:hypothetical protein